MRRRIRVYAPILAGMLAIAAIVAALYWPIYSSDADFHRVAIESSPNGQHAIVAYAFDIGALGYTRLYWAIVPLPYEDVDFRWHTLPDGYQAVGWSSDGEALVQRWEPYYPYEEPTRIETGDLLFGVKAKVLPGLGDGAARF